MAYPLQSILLLLLHTQGQAVVEGTPEGWWHVACHGTAG